MLKRRRRRRKVYVDEQPKRTAEEMSETSRTEESPDDDFEDMEAQRSRIKRRRSKKVYKEDSDDFPKKKGKSKTMVDDDKESSPKRTKSVRKDRKREDEEFNEDDTRIKNRDRNEEESDEDDTRTENQHNDEEESNEDDTQMRNRDRNEEESDDDDTPLKNQHNDEESYDDDTPLKNQHNEEESDDDTPTENQHNDEESYDDDTSHTQTEFDHQQSKQVDEDFANIPKEDDTDSQWKNTLIFDDDVPDDLEDEPVFAIDSIWKRVKFIQSPSPVQLHLSLFSQRITITPTIPPFQSFYIHCVPQKLDETEPDTFYLVALALHSPQLYSAENHQLIVLDSVELASISRVFCITMNPSFEVYKPIMIESRLDVMEESPSIGITSDQVKSTSLRFSVDSTIPCYIWCGAFRENTPLPSIVELMRKPKQFMRLSIELEENHLIPSVNYRLYCYAESVRGSPMIQKVQDTYVSFTTEECTSCSVFLDVGQMSISNWIQSASFLTFTIRSNHDQYPTCLLNGNEPLNDNFTYYGEYRFPLTSGCDYHLVCTTHYDIKDYIIERTFDTCRHYSFPYGFFACVGFVALICFVLQWVYPIQTRLRLLFNQYETRAILQSQDGHSESEETSLLSSSSSETSMISPPPVGLSEWRCSACSYLNTMASERCEMCNASNPMFARQVESGCESAHLSSEETEETKDVVSEENIFADSSDE